MESVCSAHPTRFEKMEPQREITSVNDRIVSEEKNILRSIGLIGGGTAVLYLCAIVWLTFYYRRLGIPLLMIEFPFPESLLPTLPVAVFIVNGLLGFLGAMYYDFYRETKRRDRARSIGITAPLDVLAKYSLRENHQVSHSGQTNTQVLFALLTDHVEGNKEADPQWVFNMEEFEKEARPSFPDLPEEIADSFIRYQCHLFTMESTEMKQTLLESLVTWPEGLPIFDTIARWMPRIFIVAIVVNIIARNWNMMWLLALAYSGGWIGRSLARLCDSEDRYQLWLSFYTSMVLLLIINAVDGHITAINRISEGWLPTATIECRDGAVQEGVLLAEFSDGYVISPCDPNDLYQCVKLQKDEVRSIKLVTTGWLLRVARQLKKHLPPEVDKEDVEKESSN